MKKKRYTEAQIAFALRQAESEADASIRRRYAIEDTAWVWHPGFRLDEVAVLRFTNVLRLSCATRVLLHVSADQRYELSLA